MPCYGLSLRGLKRDYQDLESVMARGRDAEPASACHRQASSFCVAHLAQIKQHRGLPHRVVIFCFMSEENGGVKPADQSIQHIRTTKVCSALGIA